MKTKEQQLRNPDIEPTTEAIGSALGSANTAFMKFMDDVVKRGIQVDWRYYTDGKAWLGKGLYKSVGIRGGQKETTVFWLSIWDGFFKVTVYLPEKARAETMTLPLADEIRNRIEQSSQMGKLKFFPVVFDLRSEDLFDTVYTLVDFRKALK
jgi:hypothetical protein